MNRGTSITSASQRLRDSLSENEHQPGLFLDKINSFAAYVAFRKVLSVLLI